MIQLALMIFFTNSLMISPTEAAVSCDSSSPQCCWVVRIWQLMGKSTSVSSTNPTACCSHGIPGVTCSGSTITEINWSEKKLTDQIPSEIGNLVDLTEL
jgi:hypothetical protein